MQTYKSRNTQETCTQYNALKISRSLFQWTGRSEYADFYERALVNGILGVARLPDPLEGEGVEAQQPAVSGTGSGAQQDKDAGREMSSDGDVGKTEGLRELRVVPLHVRGGQVGPKDAWGRPLPAAAGSSGGGGGMAPSAGNHDRNDDGGVMQADGQLLQQRQQQHGGSGMTSSMVAQPGGGVSASSIASASSTAHTTVYRSSPPGPGQ